MQAEMKEYINTHVREMLAHCLLTAALNVHIFRSTMMLAR